MEYGPAMQKAKCEPDFRQSPRSRALPRVKISGCTVMRQREDQDRGFTKIVTWAYGWHGHMVGITKIVTPTHEADEKLRLITHNVVSKFNF